MSKMPAGSPGRARGDHQPDHGAGPGVHRVAVPVRVELLTRHLDAGMAAAPLDQDELLPESIEGIMRFYVRSAIENHLEDPQLLHVMMEQGPRAPELLPERITHSEQRRITYARRLLLSHPGGRSAAPGKTTGNGARTHRGTL
ncbi:hypothetical protein ACFYQ5_04190 [Streptomyces sp. NPDC005794]|uniref:hypothetical protein n=1 Tax=Streptomyces sp. NPDC005794 TaxID=3364733 RepID=UPI003684A13E